MRNKGFTLIEVLVVIAIIGILAGILLATLSSARTKATDARRKVELHNISTALTQYYIDKGKYPDNFNCYDGASHVLHTPAGCSNGGGLFGACDQPNATFPGGMDTNYFPAAYNASMQELVDAKLLPTIPHDPSGSTYCYYDFGPGQAPGLSMPPGAIFMTVMLSGNASTEGLPPTCRPWPPNNATWCESTSNLEYCICNQY